MQQLLNIALSVEKDPCQLLVIVHVSMSQVMYDY